MSIHKMISLHPDVGEGFNETLTTAARHAMFCAEMCTSCADACVAEGMNMRQCIRLCLDCSEICTATARMAVRRTGRNVEALRIILESCASICDLCAGECERHEHGHCQLYAEMCRECARDCRAALSTVR